MEAGGEEQEELPGGMRVRGVRGGAAVLAVDKLFEARLTLVPAPGLDVVLQQCGRQPTDSTAPQVPTLTPTPPTCSAMRFTRCRCRNMIAAFLNSALAHVERNVQPSCNFAR